MSSSPKMHYFIAIFHRDFLGLTLAKRKIKMDSERKKKLLAAIGIASSLIGILVFVTNKSSISELNEDIPYLGKNIVKCQYLKDDYKYFNYYLINNSDRNSAQVKSYGDSASCILDKSCPTEIFNLDVSSNIHRYYQSRIIASSLKVEKMLTVDVNSMNFKYEYQSSHVGGIYVQGKNIYFEKTGACTSLRESGVPDYFTYF